MRASALKRWSFTQNGFVSRLRGSNIEALGTDVNELER